MLICFHFSFIAAAAAVLWSPQNISFIIGSFLTIFGSYIVTLGYIHDKQTGILEYPWVMLKERHKMNLGTDIARCIHVWRVVVGDIVYQKDRIWDTESIFILLYPQCTENYKHL